MTQTAPRLAFVFAIALAIVSPPSTQACWDGYAAVYGNVTVQGGDTEWSPENARELAIWLPRLNALVGEEPLEVVFGSAYVRDAEIEYPRGRFDLLFARVARKLELERPARRAAMRVGFEALTVQVGATRDRASAEALADRLMQSDPGYTTGTFAAAHGFYEAGGFPADNSSVHVIESTDARGVPVFRVVVGAFLTTDVAQDVAAAMRRTHGTSAYVRRL
ncbi:MAG: SPOR domain-containing protein [Polyangiales bacterium]